MLRKEEKGKKAKTRKIRRVRMEFNIPEDDFQRVRRSRQKGGYNVSIQEAISFLNFSWSWTNTGKNEFYISFHDTQGVNHIKILSKPRVEFERKIYEVQPGASTPTVRANTPFIPHRIDVESNWAGRHTFR